MPHRRFAHIVALLPRRTGHLAGAALILGAVMAMILCWLEQHDRRHPLSTTPTQGSVQSVRSYPPLPAPQPAHPIASDAWVQPPSPTDTTSTTEPPLPPSMTDSGTAQPPPPPPPDDPSSPQPSPSQTK